METQCKLKDIVPTVCLRRAGGGLEQLVRVSIECRGAVSGAKIIADGGAECRLDQLQPGPSLHDVYVKEPARSREIEFMLKVGESVVDRRQVQLRPPRRWTVHLVQMSHHDVGYTDLPSSVLREHDGMLDEVIEMAEVTRDFPEESQFRLTVEQAWSMDHFLRHAPAERAAKMIELMRSGHVELTALFGNMATTLCAPEALARCCYHAFRLKRELGIPIVSAEHNDVPGFAWGLSHVLAEAGVKVFCPRLPYYYQWDGRVDLNGFWDESAIFRTPEGCPDAFWWESPAGKRVLFYYYRGIGGGARVSMESAVRQLATLEDKGCPHSALRWLVSGGHRDNSPYVDYSHAIRDWNERWAWPRAICSTNARFYEDFVSALPEDLPVHRGELPGQDYPVGATSTAAATALNRRTQVALLSSEKLASAAAASTGYQYPAEPIFNAYEDVLWHNEHTWGLNFPAGPGCDASEAEKAVHAYRAAALAHDAANTALARIADHVRLAGEGVHLVVFNTLSWQRTDLVTHPLGELINCALTMSPVPPEKDPEGVGYLTNVALTDRNHVRPPQEVLEGRFDLVDLATGKKVPYQIEEIESASETLPYAAQRLGLGTGNYGLAFKRTLRFVARDVPAVGYKTYRLVARASSPRFKRPLKATRTSLENEFYRVEVDPKAGAVTSIYDKSLGRELVDPASPHAFGSLIVRTPDREELGAVKGVRVRRSRCGPVRASIEITGSAPAHPLVRLSIGLTAGLKRVEFALRVLKDTTPLLDAHLAFPFRFENPSFRYEGSLSLLNPIEDYFPGAYSDRLAVQNWVRVSGEGASVLWSSLDAPIASLGGLWQGYVSPAHVTVAPPGYAHPPLRPEDMSRGWIYSNAFSNNFGTNFSVSQNGDVLLRYAITSCAGVSEDADACRLGWEAVTPLEHLFTNAEIERKGSLPPSESFVQIEGEGAVLLTWKRAEDGRGHVLRLWNPTDRPASVRVRMPRLRLGSVRRTTISEEDLPGAVPIEGDGFALQLGAGAVDTVRVEGGSAL